MASGVPLTRFQKVNRIMMAVNGAGCAGGHTSLIKGIEAHKSDPLFEAKPSQPTRQSGTTASALKGDYQVLCPGGLGRSFGSVV